MSQCWHDRGSSHRSLNLHTRFPCGGTCHEVGHKGLTWAAFKTALQFSTPLKNDQRAIGTEVLLQLKDTEIQEVEESFSPLKLED